MPWFILKDGSEFTTAEPTVAFRRSLAESQSLQQVSCHRLAHVALDNT